MADIATEIEGRVGKEWETLGISNDFIFCKVMQDEVLLTELIHLILPELEFTKILVTAQKTVEDGLDTHGVRFDVFVSDDTGRIIEIEMQVAESEDLPLRLRFYGSMVDMQMLGKSKPYSELKESYVIMICKFDHYKQGRHFYRFRNYEQQDRNEDSAEYDKHRR